MPQGKIVIIPPLKGFSETTSYANQPDGTSPDVRNVVLRDPAAHRFRVTQRNGDGPYDLFNFSTGSPLVIPTLTVPADGGPGDPINLPRRDCSQVITISDGDTGQFWADASNAATACGPGTFQPGGQPNNTGSPITGTMTVTGPGGTTDVPITQPPTTTPAPPVTSVKKPWLKVVRCSDGTFAFWIDQSVLAVHNALCALQSKADGTCYRVTAIRTATPDVTDVLANYNVKLSCSDCTTDRKCYYAFKVVYDCDAAAWGAVTYDHALCTQLANIPAVGSWVRTSQTATTVTYFYYVEGAACTTNATCTVVPSAPAVPVDAPECPAVCGPCDLYVGQIILVERPTFTINGVSDAGKVADLAALNTIPSVMQFTVTTAAPTGAIATYTGDAVDPAVTISELLIFCYATGDLSPGSPPALRFTPGTVFTTHTGIFFPLNVGNGDLAVWVTSCFAVNDFTWGVGAADFCALSDASGSLTIQP